MIVVIEGISACGKSSWCSSHAAGHVVAENGRINGPDRAQAPAEAAAFWALRNLDRWQAAIAMDYSTGLAICDTDPLKLHYIWCLWKIGEAREADWHLELAATRKTFAQKQIGFGDLYYIGVIEPAVARQRKQADPTRSRRNFELHVRLQPALIAWYETLSAVLPGQVFFGFPDARPVTSLMAAKSRRYDLAAFDNFIARLAGATSPQASLP
ncbi:MAG TPA: hypothetical protein VFA87_04590 [Rhizomicrobium sp.]|nr:hypothetical protein [Rhizomicrobium sp.]